VATGGETLETYRTPPEGTPALKRLYLQCKWVLAATLLNLFPLPRAAGFQKSFAYAGQCVDEGYSVLVFPEGHHTQNGQLLPFRAGVGLLAKQLDQFFLCVSMVFLKSSSPGARSQRRGKSVYASGSRSGLGLRKILRRSRKNFNTPSKR
jgi:long-chain acyl-CoA synthetase